MRNPVYDVEARDMSPLLDFSKYYLEGNRTKKFIEKYSASFKALSPFAALGIFEQITESNLSMELVKLNISRLSNIFYKYLHGIGYDSSNNVFLNQLLYENRDMETSVSRMKQIFKRLVACKNETQLKEISRLKELIPIMEEYYRHYQKQEKILFPALLFEADHYKGYISVVKLFHRQFHQLLGSIKESLIFSVPDIESLNKKVGQFCFLIFLQIFREEKILYPVALHLLPEEKWDQMLAASSNEKL